MAIQIHFFMAPQDERDLFRKLETWKLDLYPELTEPDAPALPVEAGQADALEQPGYYLAVGDVEGYQIKRGQNRGRWKIDEVKSPVVYFCRSMPDEKGELRSGYFWTELEAAGDISRMGGKPDTLRRLINAIQDFVKARYRKSKPVGGSLYYVGPHAARLCDAGTPLREAGRKGELVIPYK